MLRKSLCYFPHISAYMFCDWSLRFFFPTKPPRTVSTYASNVPVNILVRFINPFSSAILFYFLLSLLWISPCRPVHSISSYFSFTTVSLSRALFIHHSMSQCSQQHLPRISIGRIVSFLEYHISLQSYGYLEEYHSSTKTIIACLPAKLATDFLIQSFYGRIIAEGIWLLLYLREVSLFLVFVLRSLRLERGKDWRAEKLKK